MFISPAYAQAAQGAPAGFNPAMLVPYAAIFVIFYFLLIRPQQKRAREHRATIEAVQRGDEVVTGGGLIGKVTRVIDTEVEVELGPNLRVRAVRSSLSSVNARAKLAAANDGGKA